MILVFAAPLFRPHISPHLLKNPIASSKISSAVSFSSTCGSIIYLAVGNSFPKQPQMVVCLKFSWDPKSRRGKCLTGKCSNTQPLYFKDGRAISGASKSCCKCFRWFYSATSLWEKHFHLSSDYFHGLRQIIVYTPQRLRMCISLIYPSSILRKQTYEINSNARL